jgi:hypothetical protein
VYNEQYLLLCRNLQIKVSMKNKKMKILQTCPQSTAGGIKADTSYALAGLQLSVSLKHLPPLDLKMVVEEILSGKGCVMAFKFSCKGSRFLFFLFLFFRRKMESSFATEISFTFKNRLQMCFTLCVSLFLFINLACINNL